MKILLDPEKFNKWLRDYIIKIREAKTEENYKLGYLEDIGDIIVTDRDYMFLRCVDIEGIEFIISSDINRINIFDVLHNLFLQNIHRVIALFIHSGQTIYSQHTAERVYELCRAYYVKLLLYGEDIEKANDYEPFYDLFIAEFQDKIMLYQK